MKFEIDINHPSLKGNPRRTATAILMFVAIEWNHREVRGINSDDPLPEGWEFKTNTPRELLVAVMGDGVYDHRPRWTHVRHIATNLNLVYHDDGDLCVLIHIPGKTPEDMLALLNTDSLNPLDWEVASLEDPRNDLNFKYDY